MLNVRALKAEMVRYGFTNASLAKKIGISERTFSNRLKSGDFGSREIEIVCQCLHLNDPIDIFFAK